MPDGNDVKFTVNGITMSEVGKSKAECVMVLSVFQTESGAKSALNTPNISLSTNHWEAQGTLGENIDSVIDECFKYLFEGKESQLSLELDEKEPEEGEEDDK